MYSPCPASKTCTPDTSILWATILQSAGYAIISTNPDGLVTTFNPAAERLLGFEATEVIGKFTPAHWHLPEEIRNRAQALSEELRTEVTEGFDTFVIKTRMTGLPDESEWNYRRKDGSLVPVRLSITSLKGPLDTIIGYLGIASDLSERKQAERKIREAMDQLESRVRERTRELESAVRFRDEFLSLASHELNTPLTPLLLQVQLLKRMLASEKDDGNLRTRLHKFLDVSEKQVNRLRLLVSRLLDVSRIRTGNLRLSLTDFDPSRAILESMERAEAQLKAKGCEMKTELLYQGTVCADESRFEQVVSHLITNAMKYSCGTPITVSTFEHDGRFVLKVADHGIGVPTEHRSRIFDWFEKDTPSDFGGLGLGLYISRQIILAHGGTIEFAENSGGGSVFTVKLPLRQARIMAPAAEA